MRETALRSVGLCVRRSATRMGVESRSPPPASRRLRLAGRSLPGQRQLLCTSALQTRELLVYIEPRGCFLPARRSLCRPPFLALALLVSIHLPPTCQHVAPLAFSSPLRAVSPVYPLYGRNPIVNVSARPFHAFSPPRSMESHWDFWFARRSRRRQRDDLACGFLRCVVAFLEDCIRDRREISRVNIEQVVFRGRKKSLALPFSKENIEAVLACTRFSARNARARISRLLFNSRA